MVNVFRLSGLLVVALVLSLGTAYAQNQTVTPTDIQRLQDALSDATRDVSGARARDAALATRLETELNDLRDEVAVRPGQDPEERAGGSVRLLRSPRSHRRVARARTRRRLARVGWNDDRRCCSDSIVFPY
ncbi:MAG: hypothetical protein QM736_08905 [Vicinamibacterales bacterium]